MKKHNVFSKLLENQKNTYELIFTSVLIAVGVNLLSTGIIDLLGIQYKNIFLIVIGGILSLFVIIRISYSKITELNQTTKIDGFVIYNEDSHEIVGVPEYEISMNMVQYLQAAFSENKALEKLWTMDGIGRFKLVGGCPGERALAISTHSGALFIELLEYCVIEKLSTHLTDYFNNPHGKQRIKEFQKSDIPEVLLKNRFLKLFSEDMINRAIFVCDEEYTDNIKCDGEIVYAHNSSGGFYHRFDLTLPEKSKISRKNKNEIVIETPILTLTISCLFGGFGTVLKSGFYKYYLGIKSPSFAYHDYQFNVEIAVKFKLKALFSKETEVYYAWIDSFLDNLSHYVSQEAFFERINWDTIYAALRCINNETKISTEKHVCAD